MVADLIFDQAMTNADLRIFRTDRDLDQATLAARLGCTVEHLSRMERGHKPIGRETQRGIIIMRALETIGDKTGETATKVRAILEEGLAG